MSEQRLTLGVMAQLVIPVGDFYQKAHFELEKKLESLGSRLKISYAGDIIVYIHKDVSIYDEPGLHLLNDDIMSSFTDELIQAGLSVYRGTPQLFIDNWYDGSDPNHLDITLEEAGYKPEE